MRLGKLVDSEFIHIDIPPNAEVAGQRICDVDLPKECLIVSVHRGRKLYIAHGYTTLQVGDRITVFAKDEFVADIRSRLTFELEKVSEVVEPEI